MIKRTIQIGEPVLRETTESVEKHDDSYVQQVIRDLTDTMRDVDLVGMAAPQIGESVRIFVTEIRTTKFRNRPTDKLRVFINPTITHFSDEKQLGYEGCGSVAEGGIFGKVKRSSEITVAYTNELGETNSDSFTGLLAVVIQHEMDHINGVEFIDISDPKTFVGRDYYVKNLRDR